MTEPPAGPSPLPASRRGPGRRVRRARRGPDRPVVVFVDEGAVMSFDQFAGALRRAGVETVRVTTSAHPLARLNSRLMYSRHVLVDSMAQLPAVFAGLAGERVADVLCPDRLLALVVPAALAGGVPASVRSRLRDRLAWGDKYDAGRALERAGVPVPTALLAAETPPAAAVAALGLPLMVKGRSGSGGEHVHLAPDESAVGALATAVDPDPTRVYYEKYLPGDRYCYAAAFRDGHVLLETAYLAGGAWAVGPQSDILVNDNPEVLAVGRRAVAAIGGDGLVNFDVVTDEGGTAYVIDVNLRVWHSAVALRGAGLDFPCAYLVALGLADPQPPQGRRRGATVVRVFPAASFLLVRDQPVKAIRGFARGIPQYVPWTGARYVVAESVGFARRVMLRGRLP